MRLHQLARRLTQHPHISEATQLADGATTWSQLAAGARPCLVAGTYTQNPRQTLLIVRNYDAALTWQAKLILFGVPQDDIHLLRPPTTPANPANPPYESAKNSHYF